MSYRLAIDYGTSFTSAAVASNGQRPQTIEIQGQARFPSHVFLDERGEFLLGRAAENSAAAAPERFRRSPKRDLGSSDPLLFGGDAQPVEEVVAAVLREVLAEARRRHRGESPSEVRLTHPASWTGDKRREALAEAAARAEIESPTFLPEPIAAARHFADESVKPGDYVAVYDLGGGTFDTAVVQRTENGGFRVVRQPGGHDDLGGEDFDLWLYQALRDQLAAQNPEGVEEFERSTDPKHYRARRSFLHDVREAKEMLSSYESVNELWVGEPLNTKLVVYRHEFEHLILGAVERSVAELEKTIIAAGIERSQLEAVYLTGGSSRIPMVGRRVQSRFGRADMRDDPKTVVALGAAADVEWEPEPEEKPPISVVVPTQENGDEGAVITKPREQVETKTDQEETTTDPLPPPPPPQPKRPAPVWEGVAALGAALYIWWLLRERVEGVDLVVGLALTGAVLAGAAVSAVRRSPKAAVIVGLCGAGLLGWMSLIGPLDRAVWPDGVVRFEDWLGFGAAALAFTGGLGLSLARPWVRAVTWDVARAGSRWPISAAVGGALVFVSLFLPSYTFGGEAISAWKFEQGLIDLFMAVVAAAVAFFGLVMWRTPDRGAPWLLALLGTVLFLLVFSPADLGGEFPDPVIGWWLALAGALAACVGGIMHWLVNARARLEAS